jgi:hypothetical protein
MQRNDRYQHFFEKFGVVESRGSFSWSRLAEIEGRLNILFPESYRDFIRNYGALRFDGRLGAAAARRVDLWDVRSFLNENELVDCARLYLGLGIRESFVGFASDTMGNLFCFERGDLSPRQEDAPVWFFDHEFRVDTQLAPSFEAWIGSYLAVAAE